MSHVGWLDSNSPNVGQRPHMHVWDIQSKITKKKSIVSMKLLCYFTAPLKSAIKSNSEQFSDIRSGYRSLSSGLPVIWWCMVPKTHFFLLFYWSRGASNSDGWLLHKLIVFMLPRSEQLLRHNGELHREDPYFWMNSPRKRETSGQWASTTYDVRCLLCWSLGLVEPSFGIMLTVL